MGGNNCVQPRMIDDKVSGHTSSGVAPRSSMVGEPAGAQCSPPFPLLFRSAFTMHVEAGHSAVPEEGPKDLRCPLCLYHTKYKRNMIDHIVLHRGKFPHLRIWGCVCDWFRVSGAGGTNWSGGGPFALAPGTQLISRQEITAMATMPGDMINCLPTERISST